MGLRFSPASDLLSNVPECSLELRKGRRVSYRVVGAGEPLLWFVGGPGLSASLSVPEARLLADRFAVHLIDPHGAGASTPPADESGYTPEGHARFYEEVRRALGLSRVTVLGHSFGGAVALAYAGLFAGVTRACVVVSGSALGQEVGGAAFAAEMERAIARHSAASWYGEAREIWDHWTDRVLAADDPREVEYMLGKVAPFYVADPEAPRVRAHLDHLAEHARVDLAAVKVWESGLYQGIDLRPILPLVQCRTLVIAGEADVVCGPAHARAIVEHLPHAELVVIRDCGHFPQFETPDVFRETMLRWTAEAPQPHAGQPTLAPRSELRH